MRVETESESESESELESESESESGHSPDQRQNLTRSPTAGQRKKSRQRRIV